jgi:hypothetical protein
MPGEGDLPIKEIEKMANAQIDRGFTIWQKWTCPACGSRQTMDTPDVLYLSGHCQECDTVSPITVCGFMMATVGGGAALIQRSLDET